MSQVVQEEGTPRDSVLLSRDEFIRIYFIVIIRILFLFLLFRPFPFPFPYPCLFPPSTLSRRPCLSLDLTAGWQQSAGGPGRRVRDLGHFFGSILYRILWSLSTSHIRVTDDHVSMPIGLCFVARNLSRMDYLLSLANVSIPWTVLVTCSYGAVFFRMSWCCSSHWFNWVSRSPLIGWRFGLAG